MSKRTDREPSQAAPSGPLSATSSLLPLGAFAAGFGMLLGSAVAQTAPPATGDAALPEVKVRAKAEAERGKDVLQTTTSNIGKGNQEIRDIPQSLTVMTERLIDDAKLDTLKQALHYTAGITFAATENGTDQDIRLRGFPIATTGDLLIDGMKDPSQYDRDSFNYDRIEVLRGSASMLFGRGSTGGVVNQVNKQPTTINFSEILTSLGTGNYARVTGDFNRKLGDDTAMRINVMGTTADNHGAGIDKHGIAPTVRWGIGTRDEFSVGLFYLNSNNVPMSSLRYLSGSVADKIPAKNFYGTASDYALGEATYGKASWIHRFGDGGELTTQMRTGTFKRATWGTTAGYCGIALNAAGTCPTTVPPTPAVTSSTLTGTTALTRSGLAPRKDTIQGTYFQSDYGNKFQLAGMTHNILAGVDGAYEKADRFGGYGTVGTNYNKGGTAVNTPNDERVTAAVPVYRKTSDYEGHSMGAYLQDLVAVTSQLKLLGGLRFDRFEAKTGQLTYNAAGAIATAPTSSLKYPSLWSYRTGLLFQPTATQSYHLSYGTSFNTSVDTYQYTNQTVADVPAEKSRNIELGAKLDWLDGDLSTRLAIFRTDKYNERVTDADFASTVYTLSGQRHSQGVELDVVGRVTKQMEVYLSYSYIARARIDKAGTVYNAVTGRPEPAAVTGQPVGLTPRHTGAVWVSYQLMPSLRVAGGARGASTNRPLQGTTGAASTGAKAPGYVAYDAMVEYTINQNVYTQLNVSNVTDKVYGDQLYPGFYTPGEARAVKLSVGLKF